MKKIIILSMVVAFVFGQESYKIESVQEENKVQNVQQSISTVYDNTKQGVSKGYEKTQNYFNNGSANRDVQDAKKATTDTYDRVKDYTTEKYENTKEFINRDGKQYYDKTKSWFSDTINGR